VRRPFIQSETLEPTQVAGFNQFFSGFERFYGDVEGTLSHRFAIGIDQRILSATFAGVEVSRRNLETPSFVTDTDYKWREVSANTYLYRTLDLSEEGKKSNWKGSLIWQLEIEEIHRPQVFSGVEGIMDLRTTSMPVGVGLFSSQGMSLRLTSTYTRQTGLRSLDIGFETFPTQTNAWVTDVSVDYRLPGRNGYLSVGAKNLFDRPLDLVEPDPFNPKFLNTRFLYGKATLNF
jgi:hypothetical protein